MQNVTKSASRAASWGGPAVRQRVCSADVNQGSHPARGTLAPASSLPRRMRPETDACPIGTRGAAVAGLASCQYRVPRMSARRRRGAATGGSPVGRSCICLPRAARRDRGWRRDETISCLHEKRCVAAGTVDDAEWLSHAVGLRLPMGQAAHWRDRSYLGLRCRPAASCGCPTV